MTADGIVDGDGVPHPVDTIIFGTGFQVTDPPISHRVRGRDGGTLAQIWQGSPKAHLGVGVAGFPNLFLLLGPNTGLGHNSVLLMIEAQIAYLRQLLAYRAGRAGDSRADGGGARRRSSPRSTAHRGQRLDRRRLPELVHRRHRAQLDAVAGQRPRLSDGAWPVPTPAIGRPRAPTGRPGRAWPEGGGLPMASTRIPVDGRTAYVSGAASGIGRAIADRLASHGCPVAIADQDEAGLAQTAELIGGPVLARRLDVRDRQAQMAFAAEVADWAPAPLGMVFNNAGVATSQSVAEGAVEDDEWVVEINFRRRHGVRAFLPILLGQDSGVIVNTSSVFGLVGIPAQSAYCASKFAVRGFTDSLRQELRGTGVRAVSVHPGGVKTNIARNARYHSHPPAGRYARRGGPEFDTLAMTTPERAAKIIHKGVRQGTAGSSSARTPTCSMHWHERCRRATSICWRGFTRSGNVSPGRRVSRVAHGRERG